jgi:hypothetical protein
MTRLVFLREKKKMKAKAVAGTYYRRAEQKKIGRKKGPDLAKWRGR